MRNVESLTDNLLNTIYRGDRTQKLSEAEAANQSINLLAYRITNMTDAAMCYAPVVIKEEQYALPEIDMKEVTSIGVAMAMLILSTMQNEIMLDTQLEGIKNAQNQKLSAHNTTILKIRQQIRRARYKSGFQKFMEWLSSTWLMKFLNSNYGKIIMFLIGAAVTIASFGSAGPAVIAVSAILLSFQAAELILGKSMGELLTQGMDDGAAKMAIQMSIDVGLMIADMAVGGMGNVGDQVEMVEDVAKTTQKIGKLLDNAKDTLKALEKIEDTIGATEDLNRMIDNMTNTIEQMEKVLKMADGFADALKNGASVAELADLAKDLQLEINKMTKQIASMMKQMDNFKQLDSVMSNIDKLEDVFKTFDNFQSAANDFLLEADQFLETVLKKFLDPSIMNDMIKNSDEFKEMTDEIDNFSDKIDEITDFSEKIKKSTSQLKESANGFGNLEDVANKSDQIIASTEEVWSTASDFKNATSKLRTAIENGESVEVILDKQKDLQKGMEKFQESTENLKGLLQDAEQLDMSKIGFNNFGDVSKEFQGQMEGLEKIGEKLNQSIDTLDNKQLKSLGVLGDNVADQTTSSSKALNKFASLSRSILGVSGVDFIQHAAFNLQKLEQRIQVLMQFYQALYALAMSEEEQRNIRSAATVDAIRTKSDAQQEFYQMIIDNQMADIQSLMSYVKASYQRAAEAIREEGETNRMIAQNLVI